MDPEEQPDPKNVPSVNDPAVLREALAAVADRLQRALRLIGWQAYAEAGMEVDRAVWLIKTCGVKPADDAAIGADEVEAFRENERLKRIT
jgi:hypothetical protein